MAKRLCKVDECNVNARTKNMCDKHYRRYKKYGTTTLPLISQEDRFNSKCEKVTESGCVIWTGSSGRNGYGSFFYNGVLTLAHRVAYVMKNGIIPKHLEIDHLCRVTGCVNPDHLEAVTHKVNCSRSINHNTIKTHCLHGHPYSGDNLYYNEKYNKRDCKQCSRDRLEKYNLNKKVGGYSHR